MLYYLFNALFIFLILFFFDTTLTLFNKVAYAATLSFLASILFYFGINFWFIFLGLVVLLFLLIGIHKLVYIFRLYNFKKRYLQLHNYQSSFSQLQKESKGLCKDIKPFIKAMNYNDFLQTPYWKIIATKVKKNANYQCVYCKATTNLEVHHKTYKNHGCEHKFWKEDLISLCSACHTKEHEAQCEKSH